MFWKKKITKEFAMEVIVKASEYETGYSSWLLVFLQNMLRSWVVSLVREFAPVFPDSRFQERLLRYGELVYLQGDRFAFADRDGVWTLGAVDDGPDTIRLTLSNGQWVELLSVTFDKREGPHVCKAAHILNKMGPIARWFKEGEK